MEAVTLKIRWEKLFSKSMSDKVRRARWSEWQKLAIENGNHENVDYWNDSGETCYGCIYNDNAWCSLQSLPCTVNPVLTFQHNLVGMACMGVGYIPKQLKLKL